MKWKTASISLLLITVIVLIIAAVMKRLPGQEAQLVKLVSGEESGQLGYYDLLSGKREIYDSSFITQDNQIVMTLASPNDNRIGVKVNLLQKKASANKLIFEFKPIYFSNNAQHQMIKNMLGYGWQKRTTFDRVMLEGNQRVVTPLGQIISTR